MNQLLASLGVSRQFAKGSMLLRQGERESNLFLIQEGLTKAYYQTRDGKVFIKSFITAGDVIGSLQALIDDKACAFSLMALEQTRALVINKSQLASLMDFQSELAAPSLEFIHWLNQKLLRLAMKKERREYEFLCLSAKERYLALMETEPELLARLSQQDIAQYLGITPVALSRIRRRCGLLDG